MIFNHKQFKTVFKKESNVSHTVVTTGMKIFLDIFMFMLNAISYVT